MLLNANSKGDKIFQRGPSIQKILFWGSKNFNKLEINYLGGPNISIYLDQGELKMGIYFLRDRTDGSQRSQLIVG